MHVENAIKILKERSKLDKIRERKGISKIAIAKEAKVTPPLVTQFFKGQSNSKKLEIVIRQMLDVK